MGRGLDWLRERTQARRARWRAQVFVLPGWLVALLSLALLLGVFWLIEGR